MIDVKNWDEDPKIREVNHIHRRIIADMKQEQKVILTRIMLNSQAVVMASNSTINL